MEYNVIKKKGILQNSIGKALINKNKRRIGLEKKKKIIKGWN